MTAKEVYNSNLSKEEKINKIQSMMDKAESLYMGFQVTQGEYWLNKLQKIK